MSREVRALIVRMALENPTWGAPHIHAELLKLGFDISERSISRYIPKAPATPEQRQNWMTFLRNHREAIAAMGFFSVPTISFSILYVLFVIHHGRRVILHIAVTKNPHQLWVMQNLREVFPYDSTPGHLICDRDAKFSKAVGDTIKSMGTFVKRTPHEVLGKMA